MAACRSTSVTGPQYDDPSDCERFYGWPTIPLHPDIDLLSGEFWGRDPQPELTWMRAQRAGVLGRSRLGRRRATTTCAQVSKDPATFSNAGGIRPDSGPIPMMIDMDDPDHWQRRKLVNRGFTPKRVRASEDRDPRAVCDEIIDAVCERGECDFVWDIAAPLPLIMIGDALGVAPEDRADLLRWSDDMLVALTGAAEHDAMLQPTRSSATPSTPAGSSPTAGPSPATTS